jgi:DNA-binding transcriptional MocR family regulator
MVTTEDNTVEAFLRHSCLEGNPGDRLPSVRDLQQRFSVSPVTVQRVVRRLVMEGRAITRPGDGTFVTRTAVAGADANAVTIDHVWQTAVLGRAPVVPDGLEHLTHEPTAGTIALDNAFPGPALQAHELLAKAASRCARRPDSWDRCPPQGIERLRALFAAELGAPFTANDVLITPGAQAALDSVFRVLARPGDAVALEDPGYPGAVVAATLSGLVPAPVPTDEHGVIPDALADVLARSDARLVVLQPRHANPTGSVMPPDRRSAVLSIAGEFGCFVVEDDWVRDLDLDGPTGPPLITDDQHGHVVSIRSLSKASAPGLRIAAVTARGPALARLVSARLAADFFVSPFLQATAAELLVAPGWQRHVVALRADLALRRDLLLQTLAEHAPALTCTPPRGGVALWMQLPAGVDEFALAAACVDRGVRVARGATYKLTESDSGHIRLAYGVDDPALLVVAAERIGHALGMFT